MLGPNHQQVQQLHQLGILPHTAEKASEVASHEQGSEQWQRERSLRLGASEVGAVGTHDAPLTRDQLLDYRRHGPVAPTAAMRRGHRQEPILAERYCRFIQVRVARPHSGSRNVGVTTVM